MTIETNSLERKIAATSFAIVAGLGLTACNDWQPKANNECAAFNLDGEKVRPLKYPLGNVAVIYQEPRLVLYKKMPGTITEDAGKQVLSIRNFPKISESAKVQGFADAKYDKDGFERKDIVLAINTDETGMLGFTTGCLAEATDNSNNVNIPVTYVTLPTAE